jgi:hypothetical protein
MRSIIYHRYGEPADVLQLTEAPELPAPGKGEVLIRATSRPIHPGDLLGVRGFYRSPGNTTPVGPDGNRPGFEGAGIIEAAGPDVDPASGLAPGKRVAFFPARWAWSDKVLAAARFVTPIPDDADIHINSSCSDPDSAAFGQSQQAAVAKLMTGFAERVKGLTSSVKRASKSRSAKFVVSLNDGSTIEASEIVTVRTGGAMFRTYTHILRDDMPASLQVPTVLIVKVLQAPDLRIEALPSVTGSGILDEHSTTPAPAIALQDGTTVATGDFTRAKLPDGSDRGPKFVPPQRRSSCAGQQCGSVARYPVIMSDPARHRWESFLWFEARPGGENSCDRFRKSATGGMGR